MRAVFSSVTSDVISMSIKKCGFSLGGYDPHAIQLCLAYTHVKNTGFFFFLFLLLSKSNLFKGVSRAPSN